MAYPMAILTCELVSFVPERAQHILVIPVPFKNAQTFPSSFMNKVGWRYNWPMC